MSVISTFPGLAHIAEDADVALPPRVIDLAQTFPLLFFLLVSDSGPFTRRARALNLVEAGRSLSDVAAALRLPLCLRRIKPEACIAPLPWVAWSEFASAQLGNHIPDDMAEAGNWLNLVFQGARACHEDFALWLARQRPLYAGAPIDYRQLLPLALYAWHSTNATPLNTVASAPWSPKMGLPRALDETDAWLIRLHMKSYSGAYPITDTWFEPGSVGHYAFQPITTYEELITERHALRNCLHTYVDRIASGACRVFTIKVGGKSVAALELVPESNGRCSIYQLKGPGNTRASNDIHAAARVWAERQNREPRVSSSRASPLQASSRLQEWWQPYQATRGRSTGPLPSLAALKELNGNLRLHIAKRNAALATGPTPASAAPFAPQTIARVDAQRAHELLRAYLGEDVYTAWFRQLEFESFDGQVVCAYVPVRFLQRWIQTHYADVLRTCCAQVWPAMHVVEIQLRRPVLGAPQPPAALFEELHGAPPPNTTHNRIDRIMNVVAARYALTRADLVSERRHRHVVLARQIAMYLTRQVTNQGMAEIGRRFGCRDHTTVIHSIRRIEALMENDARLREEIEQLRQAATAPLQH